jgi:hypothetical protein
MHRVVIDVTSSSGSMETCEVTVAVRGRCDSRGLSVSARRRPSGHAGSVIPAEGRGLRLIDAKGGRR